jgi:thioredoxin-related protein
MKHILTILFVTMTFVGFSQTVELKWTANFQQATAEAQKTGKPILIFFSGSDWCKPCIKLKKYILETETFEKYSAAFVLYNADFPYNTKLSKETTKANEELAAQFNKEGKFPKIVYLSPNLKVLGSTGFIDCSPNEYIQEIERIVKK